MFSDTESIVTRSDDPFVVSNDRLTVRSSRGVGQRSLRAGLGFLNERFEPSRCCGNPQPRQSWRSGLIQAVGSAQTEDGSCSPSSGRGAK